MRALEGRPDAWIEEAPERLSASRDIEASPGDIWTVLADHEAWPRWFSEVKDVTVTGAASGVGAERRVRLTGLEVDEEFVAWDVGERFAFTAVAMSRRLFDSLNERVTIDDLGGGRSRVTYVQAFAPAPWFRLPFRLARRRFRRSLDQALRGLAARLD